jgi:arylsulfatase
MTKLFKYMFFLGMIISCRTTSNESIKKTYDSPNVIVIFTDDQGYGDLSSYGSKTIKTPHIDALGAGGATLTDFLVASSTCSPSRAALLTGSYPIRTGVTGVLWPEGGGGFGGRNKGLVGMHPNEVTLAELLKQKNYATAMAGKWHLGSKIPFMPTYQGFDTYFGIPYSNDMNREKLPLILDEETIEIKPDQSLLTQRYTDFAMDFIENKSGEEPFFVYIAYTMPHIPIFASENFKGKSKGSVYGDVIEEIDHNVGRLVRKLKEKNQFENTIIIYTSDNGPWLSYGNHAGTSGELRGGKFDVFEGGYRVPCVISWPQGIAPNTHIDQLVSTIDLLPTICAVSGVDLPVHKIDGINVLDLLQNRPMPEIDNRLFYYHKGKTLC